MKRSVFLWEKETAPLIREFWFGNGDGTFGTTTSGSGIPPATLKVGSKPYGVVVGDFNRDKQLDIAFTCSGSNQLGILYGNGKGGFSDATYYSVGTEPQQLTVGHLSLGNYLDILVPSSQDRTISILCGKKDGTFEPMETYGPLELPPISIAIGDFNGDGYNDLTFVSPIVGANGIVTVMLQKVPAPTPS